MISKLFQILKGEPRKQFECSKFLTLEVSILRDFLTKIKFLKEKIFMSGISKDYDFWIRDVYRKASVLYSIVQGIFAEFGESYKIILPLIYFRII